VAVVIAVAIAGYGVAQLPYHYKDDDPDKGVAAQRPWCVYPAVAHFSGKGEHSAAANFTCTPPKE
jgi:hypothetical protein